MEKNIFMLLLSMILVISYSQGSNLNPPRKLESELEETILLGFDNYSRTPFDKIEHNSTFNTYFLLKNWNEAVIGKKSIILDDFTLDSKIIYTNKTLGQEDKKFFCQYKEIKRLNGKKNKYCIARYFCESELITKDLPKKINLTTNFTTIQINGTSVTKASSSAYALEKDLISLKNSTLFDFNSNDFCYDTGIDLDNNQNFPFSCLHKIKILENATFISQTPNSFKIKGDFNGYDDSKKNELITISNGYTKKIPCEWIRHQETEDNPIEDSYYSLESVGSQDLQNIDLEYAIANFTKAKSSQILILDFKDGVNGTIKPKEFVKKNSGGLSTGGIVAVAVPTLIVLLGVGGLAFFLSRKPLPPPPMKNIANNSIGVVSSEAIVHQ